MPNTLAHIAVNSSVTRLGLRNSDVKWILLGAVLPDIPWITLRLLSVVPLGIDPYILRIYSIIQASLFFSLILSFTLSCFSINIRKTFFILALGSLIHLVTDALEIKWANGVHLFAPFDWQTINYGIVWPDSIVVYFISLLGLILFFYELIKPDQQIRLSLSWKKSLLIAAGLIIYFTLPFPFFGEVLQADNHFIGTLSSHSRAGHYLEMDRVSIINDIHGDYISTFANERIYIDNIDIRESGLISFKGVFTKNDRIHFYDYHQHHGDVRDILASSGVFLIVFYWIRLVYKTVRNKRKERLMGTALREEEKVRP